MKNVLISGAGIAGPTLAYWLSRGGFSVTVVERAENLRPGGQAVDVRGAALEVVKRMGLGAEVWRARTQMRGMTVFDRDGVEIHRSTDETLTSGRLDSGDVELLREDLASILHEHTCTTAEYLFGDRITAVDDRSAGVQVHFEHASPRVFDLVIGCDGLHSDVRALAFGPEWQYLAPLGMQIAIFSTSNFLALDNWQIWLRDESAGYGIYPVRDNKELRVTLGFGLDDPESDLRHVEVQKRIAATRLAHLGGETPKVLQAMSNADDFYTEAVAQIRMPHWSDGRIALVGDAAYCASPLSGQGTSLAIVGAYVLADHLVRDPRDHRRAFERYEEHMRPFVLKNQALATEQPGKPASIESIEAAKFAIELPAFPGSWNG